MRFEPLKFVLNLALISEPLREFLDLDLGPSKKTFRFLY